MFTFLKYGPRVLDWLAPPVCFHCYREGAWICQAARSSLEQTRPIRIIIPGCDEALAAGSYDQSLRADLIKHIKYHYWSATINAIDPLWEPLLSDLRGRPSDTVLVPVPLHGRRLKLRGFNQSELLAKRLQLLTGHSIRPLVKRIRHTKSQAALTAVERQINIRDAFEFSTLAPVPSCAILVDDVITTGATMSECAAVLRQAGVKQIIAVALAKG